MKIVNVISGKGGTGKTLVVAVLAELLSSQTNARVLVVDVDIFVRGLTTLLLYKHRGQPNLVRDKKLATVSDILAANADNVGVIAIERCRNFRVWPAVSDVEAILDRSALATTNIDTARVRLQRAIGKIRAEEFDFVFLDSRAGFDEMTAATYLASDVVINVADADQVSWKTATNLVRELQTLEPPSSGKRNYIVMNKCLRDEDPLLGHGMHWLGPIPFDADIMKSYGSEDFWSGITRSLIEPALVDIWNALGPADEWNEHERFPLKSRRQGLFPSETLDRRLGQLTSTQRLMAVYGLLFMIVGGVVSLGGRELLYRIWNEPVRLGGVGIALLGAVLLFTLFGRFFVRGSLPKSSKNTAATTDVGSTKPSA